MHSLFLRLWSGILVLFGTLAFALVLTAPVATQVGNGAEAAPNEVLVKFDRVLDPAERQQLNDQLGAEVNAGVGGTSVRRIRSATFSTEELVASLQTDSRVIYAEPNYIVRTVDDPPLIPNDSFFNVLWGLQNTGQTILGVPGTPGADIGAASAWNTSTGSTAAIVAVIDSGFDYTHPDLAANVWSAPATFTVTIGGVDITCLAGTHGFNAITGSCDPADDQFYGTHVAGTVGAVGDNGIGVVGVNWVASIMGVKFLNAAGTGTIADAIDAIQFIVQVKALFGSNANVRILNNSWGCACPAPGPQALLDEINVANANGMLFVAAAGNDGQSNDFTPHYPSSFTTPNMIAVAATDNNDLLWSLSNYGQKWTPKSGQRLK